MGQARWTVGAAWLARRAHMAENWARVAALSPDMAMLNRQLRRRMLGAREEIAV